MTNVQTSNQPFVKRFEMAVMEYVILNKAKEGEVTKENLKNLFKGNLQMSSDHFDHCIRELVQDGHLKEEGNKYRVTDDGREDVEKLQNIVIELPNVVKGGAQKQGMTQQPTTGGNYGSSTTGGAGGSSNVNKQQGGIVGGNQPGQPKSGPGSSSR